MRLIDNCKAIRGLVAVKNGKTETLLGIKAQVSSEGLNHA